MSVRVPLWAGAGKFTFVETGATKGAMIGRDLFNADGTLFVPAPTPTPEDPPTETRVAWSALIEVPANIQSITALSGDGFVRRAGTGFSASPLVTADLPDVANTGAGTLLAITRDAKGRVTGARAVAASDLSVRMNTTASVALSALRAVVVEAGTARYPDIAIGADLSRVVGITETAGTNPSVVMGGEMVDASWSWTPGIVWCGPSGALTQTPPVGGLLEVGRALAPTRLFVAIKTPFMRA